MNEERVGGRMGTGTRWFLSLCNPMVTQVWIICSVLLSLLLTGCAPAHYRQRADREVYGILESVHETLYTNTEAYAIERLARHPLLDLTQAKEHMLSLPESLARPQAPPKIMSLAQALDIATTNSRTYQNRKETVYLSALDLTEARHDFSNQLTGTLSGGWAKSSGTESIAGLAALGIGRMLKAGARVGVNLSTEFLKHLTGNPTRTVSSILAVSLLQPLWRDGGELAASESLTQAERDVVYEIRSFARFKKTFQVQIASAYYRVLQQRAVVRNEQQNYENLAIARHRSQMMAQAGRLPEFQVDQAKQDELRSRDRWVNALKLYFQRLDNFKLLIGIPTDANVDLDERDLQQLLDTGIRHPTLSLPRAITLSMVHREDLKNSRDRVMDAERKVAVAANDLAPGIDLTGDVSIPTEPDTDALKFRPGHADWSAGIDLDLPLDRLPERNAYRSALINQARSERDLSLDIDQIKLDVRDAWRTLQQVRESYDIQKNSLTLARRRVDSTTLLLQAGRADTRDLLDSQAALVEAQNALIRALTDHTLARLEFFRDIGVDENQMEL